MFEVGSGKFVRSFEGHTHHVLGVRWRGRRQIVGQLRRRQRDEGLGFHHRRPVPHDLGFGKEVTSINFIGPTSMVLTSSGDKTVRIYNVDNAQNVRNFGGGSDFMYSAATTPDGKIYIGGGQDSVLARMERRKRPGDPQVRSSRRRAGPTGREVGGTPGSQSKAEQSILPP